MDVSWLFPWETDDAYESRALRHIARQNDQILAALAALTKQEKQIIMDLTAVTAAVENLTEVDASARELLTQLGDLIRQNINDPAALQALVDTINQQNADLAAAVAANTPAAPVA